MFRQEFDYLRTQHTVFSPLAFVGIGLHTGQRVVMQILPAQVDHGIQFVRRDLPAGENRFLAKWDQVSGTEFCTSLGNSSGHQIETVEHLLSAFGGLGIDNAEVVLDGPEVPIVDGSAAPFVSAIHNAGITPQDDPRDLLVIRRPVRVQRGESWAEFLPDNAMRFSLSIAFQHRDIGNQCLCFCLSPTVYQHEIAAARTFGFSEHLESLFRRGLALGGSVRNAILLDGGRVKNREGLRFSDEFVRHKALDAVGDLALSQHPIVGHYRAHRPGHTINIELLTLLMNDRQSWLRIAANDLIEGKINGFDQSLMGISGEDLVPRRKGSTSVLTRTHRMHDARKSSADSGQDHQHASPGQKTDAYSKNDATDNYRKS